jgi:hypothetical protein
MLFDLSPTKPGPGGVPKKVRAPKAAPAPQSPPPPASEPTDRPQEHRAVAPEMPTRNYTVPGYGNYPDTSLGLSGIVMAVSESHVIIDDREFVCGRHFLKQKQLGRKVRINYKEECAGVFVIYSMGFDEEVAQ